MGSESPFTTTTIPFATQASQIATACTASAALCPPQTSCVISIKNCAAVLMIVVPPVWYSHGQASNAAAQELCAAPQASIPNAHKERLAS